MLQSKGEEHPLLVQLVTTLLPQDDLCVVRHVLLADVQTQVGELQRLYIEALPRRHHLPLLVETTSGRGDDALHTLLGLRGDLEDAVIHEAHEADVAGWVSHDAPLLVVAVIGSIEDEATLRFGIIGAV